MLKGVGFSTIPSLVRSFSRNAPSKSPRKSFDAEYKIQPMSMADYDQVLTLRDEYFNDDPHTRALGGRPDQVEALSKYGVLRALRQSYSVKVVHRGTGKMVGFRFMSVACRNPLDEPVQMDLPRCSGDALTLIRMIEYTRNKLWEIFPDVDKVLRRDIAYVLPEYQRRGIAQNMLHYNLDFDALKAQGIRGIVAQSSSLANQKLLAKNGYHLLFDLRKEEPQFYVRPDGTPITLYDGTKGMQLYYLDITDRYGN